MSAPVRAYGAYKDNGHLVYAAARLGHLRQTDRILDVTYGKGVWWRVWRQTGGQLYKSDLFDRSGGPDVAVHDFRCLPYPDGMFDVVAYDPPYGLRGSINESNGGYGLGGGYLSVDARHELMRDGLAECARVASRRVLAKAQDQVCGGMMHWQTFMMIGHGAKHGLRLVERLDMEGGREQPDRLRWWCLACGRGEKGSVGPNHVCREARNVLKWIPSDDNPRPWLEQRTSPQEHAYMRPSTLLIFEKRDGTS